MSIVLTLQYILICRWLRVFLIYIMSGVGGFLLSGIFVPKTVSVRSNNYNDLLIIISNHGHVGGRVWFPVWVVGCAVGGADTRMEVDRETLHRAHQAYHI